MRDDDTNASLPLPVVVQPDPMLDAQPAGWFRLALTACGAGLVVILVLYGLSRPPEHQQMAAAPDAQAPAANAPASNAKAAVASTTGQGQPQGASDRRPQGQGKSPRADSATNGKATAPSDKAAPPAK
jgi:hypothetical protein